MLKTIIRNKNKKYFKKNLIRKKIKFNKKYRNEKEYKKKGFSMKLEKNKQNLN